jgi:serine/threonine-protein kinase HipA
VIAAEGTQADIAEFIRRVVFTTLIGNADMHLKNWSLIYPDRRRARLAPAYDLVSTIAYLPDANAALNFSRVRRFDALDEDELVHLASKARLPEKLVLDAARETVALFHHHWKAQKNHLPLPRATVRTIDAHVKGLPIASAAA